MQPIPDTPTLDGETDLTGHLWIQELPTGGQFRFQIADSGLLTFGTTHRTFDSVETVPLPVRRAAETVRDSLDRAALRAATDTPEQVTFFGVATRNEGIDYDWTALPPFVGVDIYSEGKGLLTPDSATTIFDRLGLATLPAVEKEVAAAHTDLGEYEDDRGFPQSAWRDGPAAGVLIRDKSDGRAHAWRARGEDMNSMAETRAEIETGAELAAKYATEERIDRTTDALRERDRSPTVDAIRDRLVADVAREAYCSLFDDDELVVSPREFRSAVAEHVQKHAHGE